MDTKPIYVPPGNSSNGKVFDVLGDHITVKLAGEGARCGIFRD